MEDFGSLAVDNLVPIIRRLASGGRKTMIRIFSLQDFIDAAFQECPQLDQILRRLVRNTLRPQLLRFESQRVGLQHGMIEHRQKVREDRKSEEHTSELQSLRHLV